MKIKTKIVLTISSFMVVSMASLSAISYGLLKDSTEKRYDNQISQSTENVANNLDIWAKNKKDMQMAASELKIVKDLDVDAILEYSGNLDGKLKETETPYALISKKGLVYLPGGQTVDISAYEHYKRGVKGENAIIGPTRSVINNRPMGLAVAPVTDKKGKVIGVINGGYYTEDLNNVVAKNKVTDGTKVYIVDKNGIYVTNEKDERIGNEKFNIKDKNKEFFTEALKQLAEKGKGTGVVTIDGQEYKASYQKGKEVEWSAIILVPTNEIFSTVASLMKVYATAAIVIIVLITAILIFVMNAILRPMKKVSETMKSLENSEGDLTVQLETKNNDEIGELSKGFNGMVRGIKGMVKNVIGKTEEMDGSTKILKEQFNEMSTASKNITESIQEAAELSEQQLEAYQTSIEHIEAISENAMSISRVSELASTGSEEVSQKTKERKKDVDGLKEQMGQINRSVSESLTMIRELQGKSKEIAGITAIITEIANQTNLLALNASIEAARAGEQGKGFKVVADEVKKLAEQSQKSAEQISHILKEITNETKETTTAMEKGMLEVEKGISKTNELESEFNTIVEVTDSVSVQIKENFNLIEELVGSIKEIEDVTKRNVTITEEMSQNYQMVAASSEEQLSSILTVNENVNQLTKASEELRNRMEKFKTEENEKRNEKENEEK